MSGTDVVERDDNPFRSTEAHPVRGAAADGESARAIAQVQGALVVARKFPRDQVRAMDSILQDCTLPALAEHATYEYARGGTSITGVTIRLAEAVARRWGNIECGVMELSRSGGYSECMSYAWDLETGYRDVKTFQVRHWRDTRQGGHAITDERDIYELVANVGARRKRACILAVIPLDVFERAAKTCEATLKAKVDVTDDLLAEILDRLAKYSVTKEMIEKRIQRRFAKETVTPGIAMQLKKIYNSLEDGMSTPIDWFKPDAAQGQEAAADTTTAKGRKRPQPKKKEDGDNPPPPAESKADPTKLAEASEIDFIRKKAAAAAITDVEICKAFSLQKLEDLRALVVPLVIRWLSSPSEKPELDQKV